MAPKRLGRGLDFLISSPVQTEEAPEETARPVSEISIDQIRSNRFQPRKNFSKEAIEELSSSIRKNGVIQPIAVRKDGEEFELIAGERRLRACRNLGYETIPAVLVDVNESKLLELALVENLQREDLNPIEESHAFQIMVDRKGMTHEEIGKIIGKHRSYVSNAIRLLDLPDKIQDEVSRETISAGHARALLGGLATEQEMLDILDLIIKNGLSVRETENLVRRSTARKATSRASKKQSRDPILENLEETLRTHFNTRVEITTKGKGGRVSFSFHSRDDLSRLYDLLSSTSRADTIDDEI